MNTQMWLVAATESLTKAGIVGTARLDALVLLEDALHTNRTQILAHPDSIIPNDVLEKLDEQLSRRVQHVPLAYIRGKTEFYGREFVVSPAVLEPRPESETIIELLKTYVSSHSSEGWNPGKKEVSKRSSIDWTPGQLPDDIREKVWRIADVGTGSGALGITAALELSNVQVDLLEIDDAAIEVAKTNVASMATGLHVIKSDLLAQAPRNYEILLCNLPYVPDTHTINQAAMHEPKIAIFGGPDGLDLYRKLFDQIKDLSEQPLLILTEALPFQHVALAAIAGNAGYDVQRSEDFIQVFQTGGKAVETTSSVPATPRT